MTDGSGLKPVRTGLAKVLMVEVAISSLVSRVSTWDEAQDIEYSG